MYAFGHNRSVLRPDFAKIQSEMRTIRFHFYQHFPVQIASVIHSGAVDDRKSTTRNAIILSCSSTDRMSLICLRFSRASEFEIFRTLLNQSSNRMPFWWQTVQTLDGRLSRVSVHGIGSLTFMLVNVRLIYYYCMSIHVIHFGIIIQYILCTCKLVFINLSTTVFYKIK